MSSSDGGLWCVGAVSERQRVPKLSLASSPLPLTPLPPHPSPLAGLHDEAFQLAEAAFVGTQLARALERAFASLAGTCVRRQLAAGRRAAGASSTEAAMLAPAGGGDAMETDEATAGRTAGGAAVVVGSSRHGDGGGCALADWRRLKDWLRRCGGFSLMSSCLPTSPA